VQSSDTLLPCLSLPRPDGLFWSAAATLPLSEAEAELQRLTIPGLRSSTTPAHQRQAFASLLLRSSRQGSTSPMPYFPRLHRAKSLVSRLYNPSSADDFLLTRQPGCLTLYDMKTSTLTIRLDKALDDLLTTASRRSGRTRSDIAREALRRQLRISQFESLRQAIMPFAEARGYLTDEDVFAEVS
jgi:predicted transcriptional regulator